MKSPQVALVQECSKGFYPPIRSEFPLWARIARKSSKSSYAAIAGSCQNGCYAAVHLTRNRYRKLSLPRRKCQPCSPAGRKWLRHAYIASKAGLLTPITAPASPTFPYGCSRNMRSEAIGSTLMSAFQPFGLGALSPHCRHSADTASWGYATDA